MARLRDDTNGQMLMLSGFIVAISLIVLAVLINQAAVNGYYSSNTALEFPKEQIRDLTTQTHDSTRDAAVLIGQLNHTNDAAMYQNLTLMLDSYGSQVSMIYAAHGETVDIDPAPINSLSHIEINISFNDGNTFYTSEPEIVEVGI